MTHASRDDRALEAHGPVAFEERLPTDWLGSPAKVDRGMGASAVYMYILKNLPYTASIMMNARAP